MRRTGPCDPKDTQKPGWARGEDGTAPAPPSQPWARHTVSSSPLRTPFALRKTIFLLDVYY